MNSIAPDYTPRREVSIITTDYADAPMPARGHMPFRDHRTQAEILAAAAILGDTPAHLIRFHGGDYASVPAIANDRSAA